MSVNDETGRVKAIGYIRVSTNRQAENGFGLEAQKQAIENYCATHGFNLVTVIPDVMSGRKSDKLYGRAAAIAAIRAGLASVLIVNAMDRASRSALDGLQVIKDAQAEGWRVLSLDGVDSDKVEKLWVTMRMGFAEGRTGQDKSTHKARSDQSAAGWKAVGQAV